MQDVVAPRVYNLGLLAQSGAGLPSESVVPADPDAMIGSVTIDNNSNCVVMIFRNLLRTPAATDIPATLVAASSFKTVPLSAFQLWISFVAPSGQPASGTCYAHFTDQILSASSGTLASGGANLVWDVGQWDSGSYWS